MPVKSLMTIEEYAALQEPEGSRYELSEGELIVTPSPTYFHNEIRDRVHDPLRAFVQQHGLGGVTSETDVRLSERVVRRPDVAFIRASRLAGVDTKSVPLGVAPDLVVEIISPHDNPDDLMLKVSQYLEAGTRAVWYLYPTPRLAYLYRPGRRDPEVRDVSQNVDDPELLPGFSLPLAEVFAE